MDTPNETGPANGPTPGGLLANEMCYFDRKKNRTKNFKTLFAKTWINVAGIGVKDVERELSEKQLFVGRYRRFDKKSQLTGLIPIAVSFGSYCMGALALSADFIGAPGILLGATVSNQYIPAM